MKAVYKMNLDAPNVCRICDDKSKCKHKGTPVFKIFKDIKKSLEKQFGKSSVQVSTEKEFTILTVA